MTPPSNTQYEPEYPEVQIAAADRGDDLAGLLRIDMSRRQFATLRDEIGEDLDNNGRRESGSSLMIEFAEPFDELRDALDEILTHPQNAVKAVRLDDDSETSNTGAETNESMKPDTLSLMIILNTDQARSLMDDAAESTDSRSSFTWRHDFDPDHSRIFLLQASEALGMDHAALASLTP